MSDKKRAIKSFFTAHYGSGSGSESESEAEEEREEGGEAAEKQLANATGGHRTDDDDGDGDCDNGTHADDNFSDDNLDDHSMSAKEFHRTLKGRTPDQIKIPKRNKGSVDPVIQEKLERLKYTKDTQGRDMKYEIQKRKDFRNPSIYEKLIDHCNIREFGSNFPIDVFDPDAFDASSYYEELSKAQKVLMDSVAEKEKDPHPKVEIIHATAKKPASSSSTTTASNSSSDASRRKRSKWDEGPGSKKFM